MRSPRSIAELGAGDHICCLYESDAELRAVVAPYLRQGLELGEKVVYIVDAHTAEAVLDYLRDDGLDPGPYVTRGQFAILSREETYLRGGTFDPEAMIALLRSETEQALAEGYAALRVTGEMTWALRGVTTSESLVRYENLLNEFFPGSRCMAICQYDRRRFDPALLLDVLRTHPYVAIGPDVCVSPHFVPPAAFYDPGRAAVELAGWMQGLIESRRVEDALRDVNWQLTNTLRSTRAGTWAWNVQTGETVFSDRWAEIIGYTLDELAPVSIGTWRAYAHPDDLGESDSLLARHFAGDLPFYEFESRMRHKDGRWVWVLDIGAVVTRTVGGLPLMMMGTHLDITESKRAVEQLARREAELREAQRIGHSGSWTWEAGTDASAWSDAMYRIFGLEPEGGPLNLARLPEFLVPESVDAVRGAFSTALADGAPFELEVEFFRPDGSPGWVLMRGEQGRAPDGMSQGLRGTVADVTELHAARVGLDRAQRAEMVGRLAGGIAHDFNNQLSAINGYAELLADSLPPGDRRRDDVAAIRDAGTHAAALTRQLLAFGRRLALQPTVLDPGDVVAGLATMLRSLVPADVELVLPAAEGVLVHADRVGLEQAIVNLTLNARDAMPTGGTLAIEISGLVLGKGDPRLRAPAGPGSFVRLAVTDTGTGIDPTVLPHVFEPFFTTKTFGQGSGLGLSSVDGFAAQSGGFVSVESAVGVGSEFALFLPRTEGTLTLAPPPLSAARPDTVTRGETILLVDDEPGVRAIIARLLRGLGYVVIEAGDPTVALEFVRAGRDFDLLLADIVMPGMNGRELARQLSARRPEVPALFMSGYAPEVVFADGLLDPGLPFLAKPFDRETLATRVRELLDRHPATRAL